MMMVLVLGEGGRLSFSFFDPGGPISGIKNLILKFPARIDPSMCALTISESQDD